MSPLSKTDVKYLAAIEPFLADIQTFVAEHIRDGATMTAAVIHEQFVTGRDDCELCDLDSDSFIKGFRVAVRTGRITGIEGAKRAGYREVGGKTTVTKTAVDQTLESIEPYLEDLQAFVDLHIKGDVRMTAAVIYQKFSEDNECSLDEAEFVKAFRLALREGKITGLESAYRYGYKEAGAQSSSDDVEEGPSNGRGEVIIDNRRRLVALDKYNWAYQTRRESGKWGNDAYYSNAFQSLRGLARKLMDDELKQMPAFPVEKLEEKFTEAEKHLMELLREAMGGKDGSNEESSASA